MLQGFLLASLYLIKREVTGPMHTWYEKKRHIGFVIVIFALFALACWMRWHSLDVPFDRDSYDEGVYWQSLRSLAEGHTLYRQVFYSQPPAFLPSVFPAYLIFGQSILAARIGIVLLSLCGLLGALFVGKVLRGNGGALVALLLLVVSPLYLTESQTLQADAPSAALMVLALGLAYLWWEHPTGLAGYALAILTAIILVLSILTKLFGFADLVPISLLTVMHLWRIRQQPAGKRFAYSGSLLVGAAALVLTSLLLVILFNGSFSQLWDQVITFHTTAKAHSTLSARNNVGPLMRALLTPLGALALYGTLVSFVRRDWRVLPLIVWLLAILYLLWQQVPLFPHHLVILVPPLVFLATLSLNPLPFIRDFSRLRVYLANGVTIIALCVTIVYFLPMIMSNYQKAQQQVNEVDTQRDLQVAGDLDAVTRPDQLVITDAQFLVAQANRSTPPELVDTSLVRIESNYLSDEQVIRIAERSSVHTVLFYTGRLYHLERFHLWVSQRFQKIHDYGNGRELWIKIQ
jgi:4-amino-4-deoxy-L-arabinose transferase-like glycosyltransferase